MKLTKENYIYLGFFGASIFATLCLAHMWIGWLLHVSLFSAPLSTHAFISHGFLVAASLTLIFGSIFSFGILKTQTGSVLRAMINWLVMIAGLYCCLVVIIRATTWLCLSTDEKGYDMKNQTVYELQYGRGVDKMFQNIMRSKHCCGISDILDWSELKFAAETSTGEYVQVSDEFEAHRFVPDICCVKETPSCGNEAYDKVEDKILTSDFQVKDRKEFQKLRDNPPTDGKTVILKVPNPLKDMLLYKMDKLINISEPICSKNESAKDTTVLYIYYHGVVRKSHDGESLIACRLGEDCEVADDIPYRYPNASVFCSQLGQILGLNSLVDSWEIELLQNSGLLYTAGCQEYLIQHIDGFCIWSLLYSYIILVGLCWEIGAFHKQFWLYKEEQLKRDERPIWYEAYKNEEDLIRMAEAGVPEPKAIVTTPSTQPLETEIELNSPKPDQEPESKPDLGQEPEPETS